jgi:hypothetical protein
MERHFPRAEVAFRHPQDFDNLYLRFLREHRFVVVITFQQKTKGKYSKKKKKRKGLGLFA